MVSRPAPVLFSLNIAKVLPRSAYTTTDALGNVVGEMRYYAFGETRLSTGTMLTDRLYTGQRYIAELGIYHYNARFYSPKLGRFLSADTLMSGFANPQGLNRFSYVANNPLRYTDPTGHMMMADTEGGGGSYTTSPIADYCSTHPSVCSGGSGGSDDGGGGSSGGATGGSNEEPPGHDYLLPPFPVCWSIFTCSPAEMEAYAAMFQYPGQWPGSPVIDDHSYDVWPVEFFGIPNPLFWLLEQAGYGGLGAITVDISDDHLTLTNYTEDTHIFNVGDVERSYSQIEDSTWYVTTHGTGTNDTPYFGPLIDDVNDVVGPVVFEAMQIEMMIYITADQLPGYLAEQFSP